ncbi:MAG TPA: hypothetical protein VEH77_06405 [Roseiarcus sp.]|nr:hypothetical protein [Roseiarcus sp.]
MIHAPSALLRMRGALVLVALALAALAGPAWPDPMVPGSEGAMLPTSIVGATSSGGVPIGFFVNPCGAAALYTCNATGFLAAQ